MDSPGLGTAPGVGLTSSIELNGDEIWIAADRAIFNIRLAVPLGAINGNHDFLTARTADVARLMIN